MSLFKSDSSKIIYRKNVTLAIRIIFLLCSPAECIKNAYNIHIKQPKGFFKAKPIPDAQIYYGDEVKINPADLFEFTEPKVGGQMNGEAGGETKEKEDL